MYCNHSLTAFFLLKVPAMFEKWFSCYMGHTAPILEVLHACTFSLNSSGWFCEETPFREAKKLPAVEEDNFNRQKSKLRTIQNKNSKNVRYKAVPTSNWNISKACRETDTSCGKLTTELRVPKSGIKMKKKGEEVLLFYWVHVNAPEVHPSVFF